MDNTDDDATRDNKRIKNRDSEERDQSGNTGRESFSALRSATMATFRLDLSKTIDPSILPFIPSGYQRPTIRPLHKERFQSYQLTAVCPISQLHTVPPLHLFSHQHSTESAVCRQHTQQEIGPRLTTSDRLLRLQFAGSLAIGCAYLLPYLSCNVMEFPCVVLLPAIRFSDSATNKVPPGCIKRGAQACLRRRARISLDLATPHTLNVKDAVGPRVLIWAIGVEPLRAGHLVGVQNNRC